MRDLGFIVHHFCITRNHLCVLVYVLSVCEEALVDKDPGGCILQEGPIGCNHREETLVINTHASSLGLITSKGNCSLILRPGQYF